MLQYCYGNGICVVGVAVLVVTAVATVFVVAVVVGIVLAVDTVNMGSKKQGRRAN